MTRTALTTPTASRRDLVILAPYPPARSGIADYVAELVPLHAAEFEVTLVIADDAPFPAETGPRVLLASEYRKHRKQFEAALKLYHVGNNPDHCYIPDLLALDPGVVVLHDFNLGYLHEMATVKYGREQHHIDLMEAEYGALGHDILKWQMKNGYRELFAGYELPLNGTVLEHATAVITHSRQSQYRIAARVPHKPVWYVPHHLSPRAADYYTVPKKSARAILGLPPDETVITAIGFVTRAKQIAMTLAALESLREKIEPFRFVLAGERRPHEYDVDADIARSGLAGSVICTDYLNEESFFLHLVAADIVVNLRYPSAGEMSGTFVRALGLGVPTIVFDHGPMGELPDSTVRKIAWGPHAQTELETTLRDMINDAPGRRKLGANAAHHVRNEHDIERVAALYSRALRESPPPGAARIAPVRLHFPHTVALARKLRALDERTRRTLERASGAMWWNTPGVPLGSDPDHQALVVSDDCESTPALLCEMFQWRPDAVTAISLEAFLGEEVRRADGSPLAAAGYTLALVAIPAVMDEVSSAQLMRRINAALRLGGRLCMETRMEALADAAKALLGRGQLPARLKDAGFSEIRIRSLQDGLIPEISTGQIRPADSRQSAYATARKASSYAVWRFTNAPDGLPKRWGGRVGFAQAR